MVEAQLEIMKQANEMEKLNAQSSSFRDCFRGVNTKRTTIGLMAWLIQQMNGETLTGYTVLCKWIPAAQADSSLAKWWDATDSGLQLQHGCTECQPCGYRDGDVP